MYKYVLLDYCSNKVNTMLQKGGAINLHSLRVFILPSFSNTFIAFILFYLLSLTALHVENASIPLSINLGDNFMGNTDSQLCIKIEVVE